MADEHLYDESDLHGLFIGVCEGLLSKRRLDMHSFEEVHGGGLSSRMEVSSREV